MGNKTIRKRRFEYAIESEFVGIVRVPNFSPFFSICFVLQSNNITPISSEYQNPTDFENSVASTPCNSIMSTEQSFSSDWPDPPEIPIYSTEDEAGSIITDSGKRTHSEDDL